MIDVDKAALDFLLDDGTVTTKVGARAWAQLTPVEDYDPKEGGAVCISQRSSIVRDDTLIDASIQVRCYGADGVVAWDVFNTVFTALHEKSDAVVKWGHQEQLVGLILEPGTQRHYILVYFQMFMVNS